MINPNSRYLDFGALPDGQTAATWRLNSPGPAPKDSPVDSPANWAIGEEIMRRLRGGGNWLKQPGNALKVGGGAAALGAAFELLHSEDPPLRNVAQAGLGGAGALLGGVLGAPLGPLGSLAGGALGNLAGNAIGGGAYDMAQGSPEERLLKQQRKAAELEAEAEAYRLQKLLPVRETAARAQMALDEQMGQIQSRQKLQDSLTTALMGGAMADRAAAAQQRQQMLGYLGGVSLMG